MPTLQVTILSLTVAALFIQYCRAYTKARSATAKADRLEKLADTMEMDRLRTERRHEKNIEAMKRELYRYEQTAKHDREFIKELERNNRMQQALRDTLTSVKFHYRVPAYNGYQKTEFKLGLAPCGLTVDKLLFVEQGDKFIITQICTTGERKTFDYYKEDVQGRIEKRWAA